MCEETSGMVAVTKKPIPAGHACGLQQSPRSVSLRQVAHGLEVVTDLTRPRHRHLDAYATVIVSGSFEESSYAGRVRTMAGDVLVHPQLDTHENHHVSSAVKLIRLPWIDRSGTGGLYRLDDLDELVRIAESDVCEASERLAHAIYHGLSMACGLRNDWPDRLAADLSNDASLSFRDWAHTHGLVPETVSRGFSKAYGVTPEVFRAELKTKAAWLRITRVHDDRLGAIAAEAGFADQAHMTRWIHRLTGLSPTAWRLLATKHPLS